MLLNAALAAPQFLKGRGLDQATARFSEAFAPGAMETAKEKTKAIRQANTAERESQDKFRLAQIDLNKAKRAESLGDYDKAMANDVAEWVRKYPVQLVAYSAKTASAVAARLAPAGIRVEPIDGLD